MQERMQIGERNAKGGVGKKEEEEEKGSRRE